MNHLWKIPLKSPESDTLNIDIKLGSVLFIVGANGAGKSALVTHLTKSSKTLPIVRIAAHRQSWFSSSSVDLTDKSRKDIAVNIKSRDSQDDSRWKDDYAAQRAQAAVYDLVNAENREARETVRLFKSGRQEEGQRRLTVPTPIEALNHFLKISTLSVVLSVSDDGDVMAHHGEGIPFSMTLLSDGERNAVMLASQILTCDTGSLIVIDEPERHLHRSITEPLLSSLFDLRNDCAFVVATHEPELPYCNDRSSTLIVRSCEWQGSVAKKWEVDVLSSNVNFPDETRRAILGSRRNILFIEGNLMSLDYLLYASLFPQLSVVPSNSCKEVLKAVRGLNETTLLHWLHPIGLIDRDNRTDDEVKLLELDKVFAIDVCSIESVFYSITAIEAIAKFLSKSSYEDKSEMIKRVKAVTFLQLNNKVCRELAARRCEKTIHNSILSSLPSWKQIISSEHDVTISLGTNLGAEIELIKNAVMNKNYEFIIRRYQIKKTSLPKVISRSLGYKSNKKYEEAVISLVKTSADFQKSLKAILGPVTRHINTLSSK